MKRRTLPSWLLRGAVVIAFLAGLFFFGAHADAVTAWGGRTKLRQPDGSLFDARQWGTWQVHGFETVSGYTVVKAKNRYWYYARRDRHGRLVATKVRPDKAPPPKGTRHHLHARQKAAPPIIPPKLAVPTAAPRNTGSQPVLVILVQFQDRASKTDPSYYRDLFFGATNSVSSYYHDMSYGQLSLVPATENCGTANDGVTPWVHAPINDPGDGSDEAESTILGQAISGATTCVNFAQFDTNHDGTVTTDELHLAFVVAGFEASYDGTCGPNTWAHEFTFHGNAGGVDLDTNYEMVGELNCFNLFAHGFTPEHPTVVGTVVHEMGHILGLPDLYDTDPSNGNSNGVGDWSVMANGPWGQLTPSDFPGSHPSGLDAWSKYYEGWTDPTEIRGESDTTVTLHPASSSPDAVRFLENPNGVDWSFNDHSGTGEYWLAEYRDRSSWDASLPACGVVLYHVDESVTQSNAANADAGHKLVDVEEADGPQGLDTRNDEGDGNDVYGPSGHQDFNLFTTPGADLYNGSITGVRMHVDSTSCGSTMQITGNVLCFDSAYEPNNSLSQAVDLRSGSSIDAHICPGDTDYYVAGARRGNTITSSITYDPSRADLRLQLLDGSGNVLANGTGSGTQSINYTVSSAQTNFYFRVVGASATDEGAYSFKVDVGGCDDDSAEPNDSIAQVTGDKLRSLSENGSRTGHICGANPDYWPIFMHTLDRLQITTSYLTTGGALRTRLFDGNGNVLAQGTSPTDGQNVLQERLTDSDQWVYLAIDSPAGTDNAYTIATQLNTCADESSEPRNGLRDYAIPLTSGVPLSGAVCGPNQSAFGTTFQSWDYYQAKVKQGRTMTVDLDALPPDASETHQNENIDLALYNSSAAPNPVPLATSTGNSLTKGISFTAPKTDTYYFKVYNDGPYDETPYQISLNVSPCVEDANEPNDTPATATPLPAGTPIAGQTCNDDFYSVPLVGGQKLDASLNFTNANGDLQLDLDDPSGSTLLSSTGVSNTEKVSYVAPSTGTYLLRVYGFQGAENAYTLQDALSPTSVISFDPSGTVRGSPTYRATEGSDIPFTIDVSPPNVAPVSFTFATSALNPVDAVAGSDYTAIDQTVTIPANASSVNVDVHTRANDSTFQGDRAFQAALSNVSSNASIGSLSSAFGVVHDDDPPPCVDDASEPNDNVAEAVLVTNSSPVAANICPNNADVFAVTATPFQTITATIAYDHTNGPMDLSLQNSGGAVLASESAPDADHKQVTFQTSSTQQRYYLVATGTPTAISGGANAYQLTVAVTGGCGDDALEPNNSIAAASPVTGGTPISAQVCPNDPDFYKIDAIAGEVIGATLDRFKADGDLGVTIQDANGNVLCHYADTGLDTYACSTTAQSDGTYYVEVFGFQPTNAQNAYNLNVSLSAASKLRIQSAIATEGQIAHLDVAVIDPVGNYGPIGFDVTTRDDTARADTNYTPMSAQHFTIPPNTADFDVPIQTLDDQVNDPVEDFTVHITNVTPNASLEFGNDQSTVTLFDNDPQPTVGIAPETDPYSGAVRYTREGAKGTFAHMNFVVSLSRPSGFTTFVTFDTVGGTAKSRGKHADYVPVVHRQVTFAPGETSRIVRVTVIGDNKKEKNETVIGRISNPNELMLGTVEATEKIINDD